MKNKNDISINDVYNNEFCIILFHILSAFAKEKVNRQKAKKPELLQEDEKFITTLLNIMTGIDNCLKAIDFSCLFMRRFYGKKYYEDKGIGNTDYIKYHFDMICYKTSTLKDLYFKLINCLYSLGLSNKNCCWDEIKSRKSKIANANLFKILDFNFVSLRNIIEKKRNESAHEGIINLFPLKDAEIYEPLIISPSFKKYCGEPSLDVKTDYGISIKKAKQEIVKSSYAIRKTAFTMTKCVCCSLANRFSETISDSLKDRYNNNLIKGIDIFVTSSDCPYASASECTFWKNYKKK